MDGEFEPLTMKDRWRMLSNSFKLSTGILAFVCTYFLLVGTVSIGSCPGQPYLPFWMVIVSIMIIFERFITIPLFIKKFKTWQEERHQQQLDAETAAQNAMIAANQGLIEDPAVAQNRPLVAPAQPAQAKKKEKTPVVAKPFVLMSIIASLFGTFFVLEIFFFHPTGCSLFVLIPVTMYCTTNLVFLCLFAGLFILKWRRVKIAQAAANAPPPPNVAPRIHMVNVN